MKPRITITVEPSIGVKPGPDAVYRREQVLTFDVENPELTDHEVRSALKHLKRISPKYVQVKMEDSEEITIIK